MIFILDCCHAGLSIPEVSKIFNHENYYLMLSTGRGRTYINNGPEFTYSLTKCINYKNRNSLRDGNKGITLRSWFKTASNLLTNGQSAVSYGGLGEFSIMPLEIEPPKAFNTRAQKKSLYVKIYELLKILDKDKLNIAEIMDNIKNSQNPSFFIRIIENGEFVNKQIQDTTIKSYLSTAENLGLLEFKSEKYSLKSNGKFSILNEGANFNTYLFEGIFNWLPKELSLKKLNDILFKLLETGTMPSLDKIIREVIKMNVQNITKKDLNIALKLLSYGKAIEKATHDTYFPI